MKNKLILTLILFISFIGMAHSENKINITIDGRTLSATLAANDATRALIDKLAEGPVKITMNNYGGFEKVGALPWALPTSDTRITTKPGDIMLYNGDNIVIFYGANSWAYTLLGELETTDSNEIKNFVGEGEKEVTIYMNNTTLVSDVNIDARHAGKVFDLDGKVVINRPLSPGFYIVDNKKVFIK